MSEHQELSETHNRKRQNSVNTGDASKRQRHNAIGFTIQTEVQHKQIRRKLTYTDYTVGWICALYLEMTAAVAMLDEEHESLPRQPGDDNIYTLGSMSGHNVVIACLPNGVYGTTSATAVGINMRSSYPNSITIPLMVGIGGGVPSNTHDIRLGDIVVGVPTSESPAVRQYDYGKTVTDGVSESKGQLNKPAPVLLNAVTKLRTEYELGRGQQVLYITQALEKHNLVEYAHPGTEFDNLLEAESEYSSESGPRNSYSPRYMVRSLRMSNKPIIHYGTIGSGNQVMKDGQTRDRIAKELSIICFEMEAAGLMDYLPCLVIRGICDYCDAQKRKEFQRYAALSAAAYAKELLSIISVREERPVDSTSDRSTNLEHRKAVMEALNFEEAESRRATVKKAHIQTCKWFVEQQQFIDWHDMRENNNGLLWIKGKPGTGKSTLMKFILEKEEKSKPKDCIIISFFFNARGHHLERSVIGMYRSLVHQLLRQMVQLQVFLDNLGTTFGEDKLSVLEELFKHTVERLGSTQLLCFIDALDECPEEQIRDMVRLFEDLGNNTVSNSFRVLFSSRHYPNISIERGTTLILEDQAGHSGDLVKYINAELKIGKTKQVEQIKQDILEKSRGIFLWVVLTLKILKTEYDKGRIHSLRSRLKDIPIELNDLFRDILTRDNQRLPELVQCIQWILYAKRPLLRDEFYLAMLAGDSSADLSSWDHEEINPSIMDNFILDCSKGLAELTRVKKATVQFIHESVREFLLQPHALAGLWPGFQGISEGLSHQQLRDYCTKYIVLTDLRELNIPLELETAKSEKSTELRERLKVFHPFLEYAIRYVFCHADSAEQFQLPQEDFLRSFRFWEWRHVYNVLQVHTNRRLLPHQHLTHVLAILDVHHLLLIWLSLVQPSEADLEALVATSFITRKPDLCKKVIAWHQSQILDIESISLEYVEVFFELLLFGNLASDINISVIAASILLRWPASINRQIKNRRTALGIAAESGNKRAVQMLLRYRANMNASDCVNALYLACDGGHEEIVRMLIEAGATDIHGNALRAACDGGHEGIAKMLIEAETHIPGDVLRTACDKEHEGIVRMLIEAGATDIQGDALRAACSQGHEGVVRILIEENGSDANAQDEFYDNALHAACQGGHERIVGMLIEAGSNVNAQGGMYGSALQVAEQKRHKDIVRILVEAGAVWNPSPISSSGFGAKRSSYHPSPFRRRAG